MSALPLPTALGGSDNFHAEAVWRNQMGTLQQLGSAEALEIAHSVVSKIEIFGMYVHVSTKQSASSRVALKPSIESLADAILDKAHVYDISIEVSKPNCSAKISLYEYTADRTVDGIPTSTGNILRPCGSESDGCVGITSKRFNVKTYTPSKHDDKRGVDVISFEGVRPLDSSGSVKKRKLEGEQSVREDAKKFKFRLDLHYVEQPDLSFEIAIMSAPFCLKAKALKRDSPLKLESSGSSSIPAPTSIGASSLAPSFPISSSIAAAAAAAAAATAASGVSGLDALASSATMVKDASLGAGGAASSSSSAAGMPVSIPVNQPRASTPASSSSSSSPPSASSSSAWPGLSVSVPTPSPASGAMPAVLKALTDLSKALDAAPGLANGTAGAELKSISTQLMQSGKFLQVATFVQHLRNAVTSSIEPSPSAFAIQIPQNMNQQHGAITISPSPSAPEYGFVGMAQQAIHNASHGIDFPAPMINESGVNSARGMFHFQDFTPGSFLSHTMDMLGQSPSPMAPMQFVQNSSSPAQPANFQFFGRNDS